MVMGVLSAQEGGAGRTADGARNKEVGKRNPLLAHHALERGHLRDHPRGEIIEHD